LKHVSQRPLKSTIKQPYLVRQRGYLSGVFFALQGLLRFGKLPYGWLPREMVNKMRGFNTWWVLGWVLGLFVGFILGSAHTTPPYSCSARLINDAPLFNGFSNDSGVYTYLNENQEIFIMASVGGYLEVMYEGRYLWVRSQSVDIDRMRSGCALMLRHPTPQS